MGEVMRRQHKNGWVAVVEAAPDSDQLMAYAVSPRGEPHNLSGAVEPSVEDYEDRLQQAKEEADDLVVMMAPHTPCDCPPWQKADAAKGDA
jgi:hypothetical protein